MEGLNKSVPKETIPENDNSPEKKEKSIQTIEINCIKIETQKEYFEYPEYIQKETGILGYDRTVVLKDSLFEYLKKDTMNRYGIDIENIGINNLDSMLKIKEWVYNNEENKYNFYNDNEYKNKRELVDKDICTDVCYSLINIFSNGEYPDNCFTHEMGAYATKEESKEYNKNFVDSKFFIQKIYDLNDIKDKGAHFNHHNDGDSGNNITIFDKETGNKIETTYFSKLKEPKYFDGIKNGELFACTPFAGLNVDTNNFFFPWHISLESDKPSFGFSTDKDDHFLSEYLNKALSVYTKKLKLSSGWKGVNGNVGLGAIIQELVLLDKRVKSIKNVDLINGDRNYSGFIYETSSDIIKEIELKNDIKIEDYFSQGINIFAAAVSRKRAEIDSDNYSDKGRCNFSTRQELRLPVFIGLEEEIPQLRWGHAKYSHFMSSKGFNFIEFKHAEHLPNKTD